MNDLKHIIQEIITERKSVWPHHFNPSKKIEDTVITEILETAVWAPTHGLTQPWTFKVFSGDGLTRFFNRQKEIYMEITPVDKVKESKLAKYDDRINQVSHVVAVCMIRDKNKRYPVIEEIVATACVIENIYLCLNDYGIAGYLSTGDTCYTQQMKDFLGLGPDDLCLGLFQLGYAIENIPPRERKRIPASEKTEWIR